jgi:5,10-methylene-tetrahydrofolate dehydrogenase/methenyl tetrahydrofolate cyclohydrolase
MTPTIDKDVDGLHPLNVAQLANTKTHAPGRSAWSFDNIDFHVSCTPQGCIEVHYICTLHTIYCIYYTLIHYNTNTLIN